MTIIDYYIMFLIDNEMLINGIMQCNRITITLHMEKYFFKSNIIKNPQYDIQTLIICIKQ